MSRSGSSWPLHTPYRLIVDPRPRWGGHRIRSRRGAGISRAYETDSGRAAPSRGREAGSRVARRSGTLDAAALPRFGPLLAVDAARRRRARLEPGARDRLPAVDAFAVGAFAHAPERRLDLPQLGGPAVVPRENHVAHPVAEGAVVVRVEVVVLLGEQRRVLAFAVFDRIADFGHEGPATLLQATGEVSVVLLRGVSHASPGCEMASLGKLA